MKPIKTARMKAYVKYMGNAVSALSILFVLYALAKIDVDAAAAADWRIFLTGCLIGVCLKTVTVFLSGSAWRMWLEFFSGRKCNHREALRVYAKANIGKYMPGNVMHYVERNLFAGKLELTQKQMAAASLSEVAGLVFTAFFLGLVLAFDQMYAALGRIAAGSMFMNLSSTKMLLLFLAGAGGIGTAAVFFWKRCRNKIVPSGSRSKGCRKFFQTFLRCFLLYAAVLLTLGFILVLVYWSYFTRPSYEEAVLLTAAYTAAWVFGFVIPGAPGGIGVRELVLTLLLAPVVGQENIAILSVVHRLITILGDFTAYIIRRWI